MIVEHRSIIVVVLTALTMIGVAAGIKLAQLEEMQKSAENNHSQIEVSPSLTPDKGFLIKESPKTGNVSGTPVVSNTVPSDGISAEAYIVGDVETGRIFLEKRPDKILPFASMSKLITALIATNIYNSTTTITITPEEVNVPADGSGIRAGESFTVKELLYPLLLNSSNIAGEALASSTDRAYFLKLMSDYSWEMGMPESSLADPTGLSPMNSGTARGFFGMAQYLYRVRPDILAITRIASSSVATTTDHGPHIFSSIHPFVNDPRFVGGKTGHTNEALDTMLTIMKIDDRPIAFIVLRSQNRARDTRLLIEKFGSI
ncbi:MAG: serine hydrolase [Candidatus Taylorbacteria bacterium]|nr:serine hydrolase [Candidatus Taylorbacteria bacterium]